MADALASPGGGLVRLAFAGGLALLALVLCRVAAGRGLLPDPVSARSNHAVPTSRAGGAMLLGCAALGVAGLSWLTGAVGPVQVNLLVAALCAGVLGLLDDAFGLGAGLKLGGLCVVAALTAAAGGPVEALPVPGLGWWVVPSWLGYALGAAWVLGFVNVFNFMDGLNGMAAGTGVVLLAGMAFLGCAPALALCVAAALLGFAVPNVLAGRPFLGDAGSLSVGTVIAGGALADPGVAGQGGAVWLVAAAATPFLADAGLTLLRRSAEGEALMEAHSDHAYQRLHRAGWSHEAVALAYALLTAAAMGAGLAFRQEAWAAWTAAGTGLAAWLVVTRLMARAKPRPEDAA